MPGTCGVLEAGALEDKLRSAAVDEELPELRFSPTAAA